MDVLNLNKQKITHIVIFIFILLSLIYLYNMNMIPSHTNTNTTKTISEKFMVISEDQDLGTNNVSIVNLNQVNFVAGSENISFPDPNMTWPVTLQDLFDTKLNNSGVIGLDLPTGHTPLQGIVLRDLLAKKLVVLGDNVSSTPTTATSINDTKIQFGGPNAGREVNSASIKVNVSGDNINALCILGMSMGTDSNTRKIKMFAEGGLNIYGPTTVGGATNINGELGTQSTIRKTRGNNANLHIVSDKALYLMSKDNVIIYKCTSDCANWDNAGGNLVVENNLKVDGSTTLRDIVINTSNGGEIRKKPDSVNPDLHLVTDRNLYLMAKTDVIIYKCSTDCAEWNNSSGNLVVQGSLKVNGGTTFSGALSATTGNFSGALSCAGLTATTGNFSGALTASSTLTVKGTTTIDGPLIVNTLADLRFGAKIQKDCEILAGGTLTCPLAYITGDCKVNGNINCGNINSVGGLIKTNHIVQAGGMNTFWLHVESNEFTVGGQRMLGMGQSWHDVTGARTYFEFYRNDHDGPRMVNISLDINTWGSQRWATLTVEGVEVARARTYNGKLDGDHFLSAIVPKGNWYRLTRDGANPADDSVGPIQRWSELY